MAKTKLECIKGDPVPTLQSNLHDPDWQYSTESYKYFNTVIYGSPVDLWISESSFSIEKAVLEIKTRDERIDKDLSEFKKRLRDESNWVLKLKKQTSLFLKIFLWQNECYLQNVLLYYN